MTKALILGKGSVGRELHTETAALGWESQVVSRDMTEYLNLLPKTDIVFIAISNEDQGQVELWHLLAAIQAGRPVVTCAKAAQAYYFGKLREHFGKFGALASVGGGSCQLEIIDRTGDDAIVHAFAIQNGSINFGCWGKQNGITEKDLFQELVWRKMLEKGSTDFMGAMRRELTDALLKASISFNRSMVGRTICPLSFEQASLTDDQIRRFMSEPGTRLVTEIARGSHIRSPRDAFWCQAGEWYVASSFRRDAPEIFRGLNIDQGMNAAVIERSHSGRQVRNRDGAGAVLTAQTMVYDAEKLLEQR